LERNQTARNSCLAGAVLVAAFTLLGCAKAPLPSQPVPNRLMVTVTMPDGGPAAGAYVQAQPAEPLPPPGGTAVVLGWTGPDGRVELSGVELGSHVVSAIPDEGDSLIAARTVKVAGPVTQVALGLARGGTITGQVMIRGRTDHEGASVSIRGVVGRADTDRLGRYLLRPVPVGSWLVVFGIVGQYLTPDPIPVTIAPGDSLELPLVEIVPKPPS
jgi:hypothetical protein